MPLLGREYRVNPDDLPHTLSLISRGKLDRSGALREIDRKIREDPGCRSARRLREVLLKAPAGGRGAP